MKVSKQLLAGFGLVVFLLIASAGFGLSRMSQIQDRLRDVVTDKMAKINASNDMADSVREVGMALRGLLLTEDATLKQDYKTRIEQAGEAYDEGDKFQDKSLTTPEGKAAMDKVDSLQGQARALNSQVLSLGLANKDQEAIGVLEKGRSINHQWLDAIEDMIQVQQGIANKSYAEAQSAYDAAFLWVIVLALFAVAAAAAAGWTITRNITAKLGCEPSEASEIARRIAMGDLAIRFDLDGKEPSSLVVAMKGMADAISALVADAGVLAKAGVEGRLSTRADAGRHQGDYRRIVQGVNDTLNAVIGPLNVAANYVDRIAKGDIPPKITDQYSGDFNAIKDNLNLAIDTFDRFAAEQKRMWEQHHAGMISEVIPVNKFQGIYARMAQDINDLVNSHIAVKMQVVDVVSQYAQGNFTVQMDRLPGEKAKITNAIDAVRSSLQSIQQEIMQLVEAAVQGKLATRADAGKYSHSFKDMVAGINQTLDAVIAPLNVAANYVERIAKGDIPPKITDAYQGDFNILKNNLNLAIDNVNALVADAAMLSKAAVEGKLATRADASKHQGDYRKIVQGVNDTLDAVIGPLNVAAEYVEDIARGNIPAKISDTYHGDFNAIKNNLNLAIDNINALVRDAELLHRAAVDGRLDTRADDSRHQGDYRKIVTGVNETLDAIVGPLDEVVRVLGALAQGDLTEKIQDRGYQGTFAKLREDANSTVDNLAASVMNIKEATDAINTASKEIAMGNTDLSQRTEEQASSLEETASSMEQLSSTVKQNADNARQANQMAVAASDVAIKGGVMVQRVVGTMSDINESSRKVVDIIGVIDGIAFQTNILALNAAVEAARAGEQGRGFAVVAGEVRNLAQRSAAAAKEIKALIGDSVDKAEGGAKLVAEAGKTMEEIVTSVKRVTDIMSEIAAASVEQSSGIEQVNQAITQMDDVTQQNAALVEQSAAAAESLEDQANNLSQAVARFRVSQSSAFLAAPRPSHGVAHKPTIPVRPAKRPAAKRAEPQKTASTPSNANLAALKDEGGNDDWAEF